MIAYTPSPDERGEKITRNVARIFYVADLNVRGELLTKQPYSYEQLEQISAAPDLITSFATLLWRSPEEFETTLPTGAGVDLRWRSSSTTSGILTIKCNSVLASLSLLASGLDADADQITLEAFQRHLVRELHGTPNEPAFALMELAQRPLVATINFESPADELDQLIVALTDRCFAAAYFRTLDLA